MDAEQTVAFGELHRGWSVAGWIDRLRYLAAACEALHPQTAATYREWADLVERQHQAPPAAP